MRIWALMLLLLPTAISGQDAPIFFEPGHWTWEAVWRLDAAGLAPPASGPARAPMTYGHARAVFQHAIERSEVLQRPDLTQLARDYLGLLNQEADSAGPVSSLWLHGGWSLAEGQALGGDGYFVGEDWQGAQPIDRVSAPAAALTASGYLSNRFGWQIHGGRIADDWVLPLVSVSAAAGPLDVWAGRRRLHFGPARSGAITVGSGFNNSPWLDYRTLDSFEGIGLHVREPFRFPSVLRVLGPSRFEIDVGRTESSGRVESPWLVFTRLSVSPLSDRFMLGIQRGVLFGGRGNAITALNALQLLIGKHTDGTFENQVLSFSASYRPPLGTLPIEVYGEYGADDSAGALRDVPGYVVGARTGPLPPLPALSLALERTSIAPSCCGNTVWYRNVFFRGSWLEEGRLFAHPLGGHGSEWLAHARVDLPHRGVHAGVDAFRRWRGHENLFAPERAGLSVGGMVSLEYRSGRTGVRLDGGYEDGAAWSQHRVSVMLSRAFH